MTTGLAIMRLQPLHNGHKKVIDQMLAENKTAILMIGSATVAWDAPNAADNPYTYEERLEMVKALYAKEIESGRLIVGGLEDINNRPKWAGYVLSELKAKGLKPDTYYCGSDQDADLFKDQGLTTCELCRTELPISGTVIREWMSTGSKEWVKHVPPEVSVNLLLNMTDKNHKNDKKTPLYCDLYHLTMTQSYYDHNTHMTPETYEMFIRKAPFNGSYLIAAGLGEVLEWIDKWHFTEDQIDYLRNLPGYNFSEEFLDMLLHSKLEINVEAVPEGEIVFPNQPIVRVTGPAWQAVLVESGILNTINAQSLIATKASRIVQASCSDGKQRPVLAMGLRRAQDQGGWAPARAAIIGGATATSNVAAGYHYDIPIAGTMAHCFVMREESEIEAFKKYLLSHPEGGSVLIDTYDTIQGCKNATQAAIETGVPLLSVRLDSGDLEKLSKEVRQLLDEACVHQKNLFARTKIVASNDLDEYAITKLLKKNAPIDIFGVGTMLEAVCEQAALGGVYKLKKTGNRDVIKVSEDGFKTTIPGATDVVRILNKNGTYQSDVIYEWGNPMVENGKLNAEITSIDINTQNSQTFALGTPAYLPLSSAVVKGRVNPLIKNRKVKNIREKTLENIARLDEAHKQLKNPKEYVAGLESALYNRRCVLQAQHRQKEQNNGGKNEQYIHY